MPLGTEQGSWVEELVLQEALWSQDSLAGMSLSSQGVTCPQGSEVSLQEGFEALTYSGNYAISVLTDSALLCLGVICEAKEQLSLGPVKTRRD